MLLPPLNLSLVLGKLTKGIFTWEWLRDLSRNSDLFPRTVIISLYDNKGCRKLSGRKIRLQASSTRYNVRCNPGKTRSPGRPDALKMRNLLLRAWQTHDLDASGSVRRRSHYGEGFLLFQRARVQASCFLRAHASGIVGFLAFLIFVSLTFSGLCRGWLATHWLT